MNRTTFRNFWMLIICLLLVSAWFMFQRAEKVWASISQAEDRLIQLRREKINMESLATALAELDSLTVDERNTTRLDVLRHLNLETQNYQFNLLSRQEEQVGGSSLFVRQFVLETDLPYMEALKLADTLHANKKVVLHRYVLSKINRNTVYGDRLHIAITGSLYGIEKH